MEGEPVAARAGFRGAARSLMVARPTVAQLVGWAPLGAVIVLTAALRLHGISAHSLWLDEIGEGTTAGVTFPDFFARVRHDVAAAPLDYLAVKAMTAVLGHGTIATRAWALLLGIAAIPLVYAVGRQIFDSGAVALTAAFLLSLSAFHVFYSQEARFYSLAVVVTLLNLLAFARALDSPHALRWLAYSATCSVAFYSYYFVAFLLPLEGVYVVGLAVALSAGRRGRGRRIASLRTVAYCATAQALAVLSFVPWIVFAFSAQLHPNWPPVPDLTFDRWLHVFADLVALAWQWAPATTGETVITIVVLALAVGGLVASLIRRRFLALPLAAAVLVAIPLAWRADQLTRYIFIDRQDILVLPILLLLAAAGYVPCIRLLALALDRTAARGWLRWAHLPADGVRARAAATGFGLSLVLVWTAVSAPAIGRVYDNTWRVKEDWRGATIFVSANLCPATTLYTQLAGPYSFGIDYYNPALQSRTRYAGETPTSIEAVVVQRQLTSDDWIVLHPDTEGGGDQSALGRDLIARGWRRSSFTGVTVYHGPTCPISQSH